MVKLRAGTDWIGIAFDVKMNSMFDVVFCNVTFSMAPPKFFYLNPFNRT